MKKTRLLIALLVMLVAASGYAQDSYREAVKEYCAIFSFNKDFVNQLDSNFKLMSRNLFESGDVDQLTKRYIEERFMDYMADFMIPKMKEIGVSEAALREHVALISSPAGKTYMEHSQQLSKTFMSELLPIMDQDSLKVMNGDTTDPIQVKTGIDAGYVAKFKEVMYDDMVNTAQATINQMANLATMIFKDTNSDELAKIQNRLVGPKAWMTANLPAIAVNCAYGIITEDDLDVAAKLKALDTHKMRSLLPVGNVDMMSMGNEIMGDYIEWMEGHGAVVKADVKGILLEMINKMRGN